MAPFTASNENRNGLRSPEAKISGSAPVTCGSIRSILPSGVSRDWPVAGVGMAEHRVAVEVRLTVLVVGAAAVAVGDVEEPVVRAECEITGIVVGLRVLDRGEQTALAPAGSTVRCAACGLATCHSRTTSM